MALPQIHRTVSTALVAAVWFVVLYLAFLTWFDSNNLIVKESFPLDKYGNHQAKFMPGDAFLAHRVICVSKSSPGDFTVEVHGGPQSLVIPMYRGRLGQVGPGCIERNVVTQLPSNISAGQYALRAFAVYEINPLRTIRYELPAIPFEVLP